MGFQRISNRRDLIKKVIANPKLPIILACLAMLLVMGTVGNDLYFDDYIHRLRLQNPQLWPDSYGPIVGLFAFGTGAPELVHQAMEDGIVPWWSYGKLKVAFFRPITAVTHWVDYRFWPDSPAFMHLQSITWFGALIFTAAFVYRRMITPLWVAGLAALLYALDDAHGIPVGWLANRNALIAAVMGMLALICHDRWRRDGWKSGALLGPLCFLLALLSSEAGLGAAAYLLAYEVCLASDNPRKKITGLLPYIIITVSWYAFFVGLGFGTEGGGAYIDPGRNPVGYFMALFERLPVLLYGQWLFPNAVIYGFIPKPQAYWVLVGVYGFLVGIAIVLIPVIKQRAVARYWALGMVLALLPVSATFPDNRLLLFSGLGAMGLLAQFLAFWMDKAQWLPKSAAWRGLALVFVISSIFIHFVIAPIFLPFQSQGVARMSEVMLEKPLQEISQNTEIAGKTLIFVNPPVPFAVMHVPFVCEKLAISYPRTTRTLASGLASPLNITRLDEFSLEVEPDGGFINQALDRLYRGSSHPMRVGQRIELSDMTVEVLAITEDQRPWRARFTFRLPLKDPSMCFYRWENDRFIPFKLPDVGQTIRLSRVEMPL